MEPGSPESSALQADSLPTEPSGSPAPECPAKVSIPAPTLVVKGTHLLAPDRCLLSDDTGHLSLTSPPSTSPQGYLAQNRCSSDAGLIPGLGRSAGGGHGNPLQYSCLENSMDRGAWWATVHGVAKSWTRLTDTFAICVGFPRTDPSARLDQLMENARYLTRWAALEGLLLLHVCFLPSRVSSLCQLP